MWIQNIGACEGGDVTSIANVAALANLTHVCVKVADGRNECNDTTAKLDLKAALYARGIAMWGWHYVYGNYPDVEAALGIEQTTYLDLPGYIIDAEDEYIYKNAQASQFMKALQVGIGGHEIALSSHRYPELHPLIPWAELLGGCTLAMPQVYWIGSHDPSAQLAKSVRQYKALTAIPIVPTGPAFSVGGWSPTGSEINQFLAAAKASQSAANMFDWDAGRPYGDWWNAICSFQW